MQDNLIPIRDWSQAGRRQYVEKNRLQIELVIKQALEDFDEITISKVFNNQDSTVEKIIELFLAPQFQFDDLPKDITKDIRLFSQLNYWVKYKTAGNVSGKRDNYQLALNENKLGGTKFSEANFDSQLEKLASNLKRFSQCVAPDLIGYWLLANKKLLSEMPLLDDGLNVEEIDSVVSNTQKTRYKADASFRYLYLFLNIAERLDNVALYEEKYLVKGLNRPQYVANHSETHATKHQIRLIIKKIINQFLDISISLEDQDVITRALFRVMAKKAVLDLYEMDKDKSSYEECYNKLKLLTTKPSLLKELRA